MKTFIKDSFFFNYPMVLVFPFWLFYILIGIILGPLMLVIILVASPMQSEITLDSREVYTSDQSKVK
jgi:hypothetical protein